ncbi:MAG: UDP-glucose 4-epimerase GalE [Saprospiraceae bacterium]
MTKILVTGASGYIGSHTMIDLLNNDFEVVGVDNQINSSAKAYDRIKTITGKSFKSYHVNLCNKNDLFAVFEENPELKAVIHFAALKSVEESMAKPFLYYENNLVGLINLLEAQDKYNVQHHIFSSSCTVYGNTSDLPVTENSAWNTAESPYGLTKQLGESMIENMCKIKPYFKASALRYFNPAGAHPSALLGEAAIVEVRNLIPLIMEVGFGKRAQLLVFGNDYPTRDGTNIRDYIHIMDLAHSHTLALKHLLSEESKSNYSVYNIGSGTGVSILEAIHAFEKISDKKLNFKIVDRRPGDVIAIYADFAKAEKELGWRPQYSIEDIMQSAWKWEKNKVEFLGN